MERQIECDHCKSKDAEILFLRQRILELGVKAVNTAYDNQIVDGLYKGALEVVQPPPFRQEPMEEHA